MRVQPRVYQPSPEVFLPSIPEEQPPSSRDLFRLAVPVCPSAGEWARGLWARIDWVAVASAAFVYTIAFVAWLYLAK